MEEEHKEGWTEKLMGNQMRQIEASWDKCSVCHKPLPPGSPMNKLYDDELGSLTVCVDCSLKAILVYVRRLYGKDVKK